MTNMDDNSVQNVAVVSYTTVHSPNYVCNLLISRNFYVEIVLLNIMLHIHTFNLIFKISIPVVYTLRMGDINLHFNDI